MIQRRTWSRSHSDSAANGELPFSLPISNNTLIPHSSNMLYPKEDSETHRLQFACRTCQYSEEAHSSCVFRNVLNNAVGETAGVTQDVGSDPTVSLPLCLLCVSLWLCTRTECSVLERAQRGKSRIFCEDVDILGILLYFGLFLPSADLLFTV